LQLSFNWFATCRIEEGAFRVNSGFNCDSVATGKVGSSSAITRSSLLKELTAGGVRITSQRRLLVGIIQDSPRHLNAAEILELARKRDSNIDRATVYRTISLLKRRGLIDELDLMHVEGEKHYYEAKTNRDHCHMTCLECGAVIEYASPAFERLRAAMARQEDFLIRVVRLEVGGLCSGCRKT